MSQRYTLMQKLCAVVLVVLVLMVSGYFLLGGHAVGKNFGQSPEDFVAAMNVRLTELMVKWRPGSPDPAVLPLYTVSSRSAYSNSKGKALYLEPNRTLLRNILQRTSLSPPSFFVEQALTIAEKHTTITVWEEKNTGMMGFIDVKVKNYNMPGVKSLCLPILESAIFGAISSKIEPGTIITQKMLNAIFVDKLKLEKKKNSRNELYSDKLLYEDGIMYYLFLGETKKEASLLIAKGMTIGEVYDIIGSSRP